MTTRTIPLPAQGREEGRQKADNGQAERIIALLGGRENIVLVDACMTRLRVTVKDPPRWPTCRMEG